MHFEFNAHQEYDSQYNETSKRFDAEVLDDVIIEFENFLRGCGFVFDGNLILSKPFNRNCLGCRE